MKKRPAAALLTVALVGLGVLGYFSARQQSPGQGEAPPPETASGVRKDEAPAEPRALSENPPPTPAQNEPASDPLPALSPASLKQYRNEVKKNAHVTPPSVLRFAEQVSVLMERAKAGESAAKEVFNELERCVSEKGETPPPMKALCLWNAQRLARDYPKAVDSRYQALYKATPDNVTDLLEVFALQ